MKYTREQKKVYFAGLRAQWQAAKLTANIDEIKAIIQNFGLGISPISYAIVAGQMAAQGLDGLPYLDCKTYQGWVDNGFQVRKGEKSTIDGLTWREVENKKSDNQKDDDDNYMMPVAYHLFHRTQVDPILEDKLISYTEKETDNPNFESKDDLL